MNPAISRPFPRVALLVALLMVAAPFASAAFPVEETTIAKIQAAIVARKLTATELVKLYLARIKAYNGQSVEMPQGLLDRKSVV